MDDLNALKIKKIMQYFDTVAEDDPNTEPEYYQELRPFLEDEMKRNPPEDIVNVTPTRVTLGNTIFEYGEALEYIVQILTAANKRLEQQKGHIFIKPDKAIIPIAKLSFQLFNPNKAAGGSTIKVNTAKDGQPPLLTTVSIDYDKLDGVNITKQLTAFDRRVHNAVVNLYAAGNTHMTLSEIHTEMGFESLPNSRQLDKIDAALTKLSARVYIDNTAEAKRYPNYTKFVYDGDIIPFMRGKAYINGKCIDSAIILLETNGKVFLPLYEYAKQRKQITTVKREMLQTPTNKTERTIALEDYLLLNIQRYKRDPKKDGKKGARLTFATIFKETGITGYKAQGRAKETIRSDLEYWKNGGLITGATMNKTGITFYWKDEK